MGFDERTARPGSRVPATIVLPKSPLLEYSGARIISRDRTPRAAAPS
ncbi:hypothetical protein [Deinococcus alpinitundrae]|nr:hypothetical protein [Deinococcus alpinitundrae]